MGPYDPLSEPLVYRGYPPFLTHPYSHFPPTSIRHTMSIQLHTDRAESRVKSVAFHATAPLLAAGLHNGHLEVWDIDNRSAYLTNTSAHRGPIRSVDFHRTKPHLLCSGGDDRVLRVWTIDSTRLVPSPLLRDTPRATTSARSMPSPLLCGSLQGHTDYIRSVHFHDSLPWVLSAADDQTVRIWDWLQRSCIKVCHGHAHYVMAARFHPSESYFISGSLDMTIRVWDFSNLIAACAPKVRTGIERSASKGFDVGAALEGKVTLKCTVEAHSKGVSGLCFHATKDCFVSVGDDRSVRIWAASYSTGEVTEIGRMTEHSNNVTGCVFADDNTLLSCGEDGTLFSWDIPNRRHVACGLPQSAVSQNTRLWGVAQHARLPYAAVGTDTGLAVVSLSPMFPTVSVGSDFSTVVVCEGREIALLNIADKTDIKRTVLKRFKPSSAYALPHRIRTDPSGKNSLYAFQSKTHPNDGTFYALHCFGGIVGKSPKSDAKSAKDTFVLLNDCSGMPVFLSDKAFAHIDGQRQIVRKTLRGEISAKVPFESLSKLVAAWVPAVGMLRSVDRLFAAPEERLLIECTTVEGQILVLYDFPKNQICAIRRQSAPNNAVIDALWGGFSQKYCVIRFETSCVVCDESLRTVCVVQSDGPRIDSLIFDSGRFFEKAGVSEENALLYFTAGNQLMFAVLPSGEVGAVASGRSRALLLHGDMLTEEFIYGVAASAIAESEVEKESAIALDARLLQKTINAAAVKLEILAALESAENVNQIFLKECVTAAVQMEVLPFAVVQRIVSSSLNTQNTLRLLQCIDAESQNRLHVQKWLFELAVEYTDIAFALERVTVSQAISNAKDAAILKEMWLNLLRTSIATKNFDVAQRCAREIPQDALRPWEVVLFGKKESCEADLKEKDQFSVILNDLLQNNRIKAAETLHAIGFEKLAVSCQSTQELFSEKDFAIDWTLSETPNPAKVLLQDYYIERTRESPPEAPSPVTEELLPVEPLSPASPSQPPAALPDDPFDFIFESSEEEA